MGLDSVELVISYEEAFGISIPDAIACEMRTPRDVIDYVMSQVEVEKEKSACLSQQTFYALRRHFTEKLGTQRSFVNPHTLLDELIPKENRRVIWHNLGANAGTVQWFGLTRPMWLQVSLYALPLVLFSFIAGRFGSYFAALCAFALTYCAVFMTRPFKTHFPRKQSRVRDLVRFSLLDNPQAISDKRRAWTRAQVAEVVREITLRETGIDERKYREDARFIDDMGVD
jgi:hypothetical protein